MSSDPSSRDAFPAPVWHWLRRGKRLEWVIGLGASIGVLLIATQGLRYHDVTTEILFVMMGVWIVLPMALLPLIALRRLRRRDTEVAWGVPKATLTPMRRAGVHVFLLILALLSARVEIEHGFLPILGSASSVYLWNLALACIVITSTELSIWRRSK
jgi:hypothetical protein